MSMMQIDGTFDSNAFDCSYICATHMLCSSCHVHMQINDVKLALNEKQRLLTTAVQILEPDDQLQDTMLAAYWAAVNV